MIHFEVVHVIQNGHALIASQWANRIERRLVEAVEARNRESPTLVDQAPGVFEPSFYSKRPDQEQFTLTLIL